MRVSAVLPVLVAGILVGGPATGYDGPFYQQLALPVLRIATNTEVVARATEIRLTRDRMEQHYRIDSVASAALPLWLYFPLEPIDRWHADNVDAFGPGIAADPLALTATMDGAPFPFSVDARATFLGMDVSAHLANAGLPLLPFGAETSAALEKLAPDAKSDLAERGILTHWGPMWQLETAYAARFDFAAGAAHDLVVAYRPVFGEYVESLIMLDGKLTFGLDEESYDFLCLTEPQLQEIDKRFAARKDEEPYRPYTIADISMNLAAANEQYGSIDDLDFTVETRKPSDILATCGGEFEKVGPTTYRWKAEFADEQPELKLFFLEAVE